MKACKKCKNSMFDADIDEHGLCEKCEAKEKDNIVECKKCKKEIKAYYLTPDGVCAECEKIIKNESKKAQPVPPEKKVYCSDCGSDNSQSSFFCKDCGYKIQKQSSPTSQSKIKKRWDSSELTIIVWVFLCIIGIAIYFIIINIAPNLLEKIKFSSKNNQVINTTSTIDIKDKNAAEVENLKKDLDKLKKNLQFIKNEQVQSNISLDSYSKYIPSVARLFCEQDNGDIITGSGVLRKISSNQLIVVTNAHVVGESFGCVVAITKNARTTPSISFLGVADFKDTNDAEDIATLTVVSIFDDGNYRDLNPEDLNGIVTAPDACLEKNVNVGDKLFVLGWPAIGGNTITITDGIISGFSSGYFKTSAKIDQGNSGGLAMHNKGCVLGIPTLAANGELESLGYIIDLTQ